MASSRFIALLAFAIAISPFVHCLDLHDTHVISDDLNRQEELTKTHKHQTEPLMEATGSVVKDPTPEEIEHWRQDFIIARDTKDPNQLESFLETLRAEHDRLLERFAEIKEEAHNRAREWHDRIEVLKEVQQQAEEQLTRLRPQQPSTLHQSGDPKTPLGGQSFESESSEQHYHKVPLQQDEEGFLDRLIHKLSDD